MLAGPARRGRARAAVPHPAPQPGRMRLHSARELLHALDTGERAGRLAPDQAQQPGYPLVAEVLMSAVSGYSAALTSSKCIGAPTLTPGLSRPPDSTSTVPRSSASRSGFS